MNKKVYCITTEKGIQSFYLEACGETHYLFSQNFRRGVKEYFGAGVHLDAAIDYSRAGHDAAILRTMRKLPSFIKYIEKQYGIEVFRRRIRRKTAPKRSVA
jgi:hypothetical protein